MTFRPTFVIDEDLDEAYCEEEFMEMRIANIMLRQVGPCVRCKTTSLLWKKNMRHPELEPYTTIDETRNHKEQGGPLFGTYLQPDIIGRKEDFEELLGQYEVPKDRSIE